MTDKKDGPGQKEGSAKAGERAATEGGKRPFATIDLKAVEVPSEAKKSGPVPPKAAEPPAPKAPQAAVPKGQSEAARKVSAAAADQRAPSGSAAKPGASPGQGTASPSAAAAAAASGARTAPPPPAGLPPQSGRSRGFVSHLLAGAVGAALALVAAPLLGPSLAPLLEDVGLGAPPPPVSPQVAQRLAALEKKVSAPAAAPPPEADPARANAAASENAKQIAALQKEFASIGELQASTAKVTSELQARLAKEPPIADVGSRLQAMEQQLSELAAAARAEPDRAGRIPQLAQMSGRIADLETALSARVGEVRKDVGKDIETRLAPVTEAAEAARSATQRLDREVASLKSETNRLATGVDQVKNGNERLQLTLKAAQDDTAKLGATLDQVRRDLEVQIKTAAKPTDVSAAVAPLATQLGRLESNLTTVVKSESDRNATAERIVLSLELGNLKRAMERGLPYARELAEVAKVSGSRIDLRPLEPYKSQGVPTLPELTRSFRPVAHAILDAEAEKSDGTVMDRLWSGAKSFVRVRKTTHASSDNSPEAVVARIEDALAAGRLADVLTAFKSLDKKPDIAKQWLAKVEARQTVDAALKSIDEALKASLGAGPASPAASATQKKSQP